MGCVLITPDLSGFVIWAWNEVRCFDVLKQTWSTMADNYQGQPLEEPNDLAFDADGNLIFPCPGNSRQVPTGLPDASKVADQNYRRNVFSQWRCLFQ